MKPSLKRTIGLTGLSLLVCSTVAAQQPPNGSPPPNAAAAKPAAPGKPKPFDEIVAGATRTDGFFPIWKKDSDVWLEIPAKMLETPFLFTTNISHAVGERGLYASQMGLKQMAQWRKVGNQLQLLAVNQKFRAQGGGARATAEAFSPSLLGSGPILSAEHPERKSLLINANFLLNDIPGISTRLEMAYRLPFGLDKGNSSIESTRADATLSVLTARMHFATPRIPAPPQMPSPGGSFSLPEATPDPRSMFMTVVYNLRALPEQPMTPRLADPRLGHFTESYTDLSDDLKANPRVHLIKRWRLDKKDPAAALSEPVQPIVFWMDKNIPPKVRPAVEAGILEWNKAFEKIGFKNAIVAKQQPDDAKWDNMDAGHASVRWFVGADVGFAIGPSHADPRTGEILDADIGMSDVFGRGGRRLFAETVGMSPNTIGSRTTELSRIGHLLHQHDETCHYADEMTSQMEFGLDLLTARGDIAPNSPEVDALVLALIKDVIMHEVGHTLGLKHNFRASTAITQAQLKDKTFTDKNGISASVMDYNAYNLPLREEKGSNFNNTTLGAYDYWAIEYAYKPIPKEKEQEELDKIAARSTDPLLTYADDLDAGGYGPYDGADPLANRFDLGEDPLAWYQRRLSLSKELWARVQTRTPKTVEDRQVQRRSLMSGFRQLRDLPELASKYVGGVYTVRDQPGSGRPTFRPVEPKKQRDALQFLAKEIFSVNSFQFKPEFLANLPPDFNEWERAAGMVDIPTSVLQFQSLALNRLMSGPTAQRLLDAPLLLAEKDRKNALTLTEVYGTLQSAIWSELKTGRDIDRMRRNLQRDHLKRMVGLLTRGAMPSAGGRPPSAPPPADALSVIRVQAMSLQRDLRQAIAKKSGSAESQAHLQDSLVALTEALRATMQRI